MPARFCGEVRVTLDSFRKMCQQARNSYSRDQRSRCVIFSVSEGDILLISSMKQGGFTDTTDTGYIFPFHCMPVYDEKLRYQNITHNYDGEPFDVSEYAPKKMRIEEKDIGDYWRVILVDDLSHADISKVAAV